MWRSRPARWLLDGVAPPSPHGKLSRFRTMWSIRHCEAVKVNNVFGAIVRSLPTSRVRVHLPSSKQLKHYTYPPRAYRRRKIAGGPRANINVRTTKEYGLDIALRGIFVLKMCLLDKKFYYSPASHIPIQKHRQIEHVAQYTEHGNSWIDVPETALTR